MGGGPFDAGKGGQGDTYGPTGEAGFLRDNRSSFAGNSSEDLLKLGYAICKGLASGGSENSIKTKLIRGGVDEVSAGAVVISAQMYLCP
jgi:hypothetical protein